MVARSEKKIQEDRRFKPQTTGAGKKSIRSSAPRALRLVEEQKLERDDEQQSKKQDEVRKGNFLGKNSADRFTD